MACCVRGFFYAYRKIEQSATLCISESYSQCRDFVPWLWVGVALTITGLVMILSEMAKRGIIKRKLLFVVATVILMASIAALPIFSKRHTKNDSQVALEANIPSGMERRMATAIDKAEYSQTGSSAAYPFPDLPRSRSRLPLEGDPFIATSKEEQSWLDRNRYPNAKQWIAYNQASDGLLAQAAAAGDRTAAIMLDHRQLVAGDDSKIDALLTEGARGSTFALDILASFLANGDSGGRVTAYAISRASEMRGNIRLGPARDVMFNSPLSPSDRIKGEAEALEIYSSLFALQKKMQGPNAKPVDPRPIGG